MCVYIYMYIYIYIDICILEGPQGGHRCLPRGRHVPQHRLPWIW